MNFHVETTIYVAAIVCLIAAIGALIVRAGA
jgi:hypothetical protein